jgi:hypothetical protein
MDTPETSHVSTSINSFKDVIQIASTLLIGASTLFFVIGLLVVNLRLSSYGVHYLEIDRAEYVLVGVVTVFLAASCYFALKLFFNRLKLANTHRKAREFKKAGLMLFEAGATLLAARYVFTQIASEYFTQFFKWEVWVSIVLLGFIGKSTRTISAKVYTLSTQMRTGQLAPESFAQQVTSIAELVAGLIAVFGMYSFMTYPMISMGWGGGHRDPVEIFLTARGNQVAKELGLPMVTDGAAGPLYVLSESAHEVVVTTQLNTWGQKSFVRLQRELIEATKSIQTPAEKLPVKPRETPTGPLPRKDVPSSSGRQTDKGNLLPSPPTKATPP